MYIFSFTLLMKCCAFNCCLPPRAPLLAHSRVPGWSAGRSHLQQHEVEENAQVSQAVALQCHLLLLCSNTRAVLLWVLQDAPVPEVVDVTTEENQLGVRVLRHLAVQRGGILL